MISGKAEPLQQLDGRISIPQEEKKNAKKKKQTEREEHRRAMQRPCQMPSDVFLNAKSETAKVQIEGTRRLFWAKAKMRRKEYAQKASFQRKA